MQDLKQLQQLFKKAINGSSSDIGILPIKESSHFSKKHRMQVYQNAFYFRLAESIIEDFPETFKKIQSLEDQQTLLEKFLIEYPSTFAHVAEYSERFPDYLTKHHPEWADLANLEWKRCLSLYAKDQGAVTTDQLAATPIDQLLAATLTLHPSLQLAQVQEKFYAIWRYNGNIEQQTITQQKYDVLQKLLQKKSLDEIIGECNDEALISETFQFLSSKKLMVGIT